MRPRDETGYTLVELLVAMALGLVVLGAVLTSFESLLTGAASSSTQTQAEDEARSQADQITELLRNARPAAVDGDPLVLPSGTTTGQSNDVAFTSFDGPGTAGRLHVMRLCVNATTDVLWRETLDDAAAYASNPPGTACPGTSAAWSRAKLIEPDSQGRNGVLNATGTTTPPLFTIAAGRRAVDVDLRVSGRRTSSQLQARSSAYLRSATERSQSTSSTSTTSTTSSTPGVDFAASCSGTTAIFSLTGTTASATFKRSSDGQVVGVGQSVAVPALTAVTITPYIYSSSSGALTALNPPGPETKQCP